MKEWGGMGDFRMTVSNSFIYVTLLLVIFRETWIFNRMSYLFIVSERITGIIQNSLFFLSRSLLLFFFFFTIIFSHLSNFPKIVWINLANIQKGNSCFCWPGSWELRILPLLLSHSSNLPVTPNVTISLVPQLRGWELCLVLHSSFCSFILDY